jgi:hypothetical protein
MLGNFGKKGVPNVFFKRFGLGTLWTKIILGRQLGGMQFFWFLGILVRYCKKVKAQKLCRNL